MEELSHGNQQRAQLAAALVHEPELLVLDEPFAGLDPLAVRTLAEVLRGEAARGAAVVFSSHQLELVEDICEDVVIIDHGRIVATGTVDALRRGSGRRRIELELEDASATWLPTIAGVELLERRNGALSAARRPRRRPGTGPRGGAACRWGRRLQLRPTLALGALRGTDRVMSARRAISLVAWREIRERLRSPAFLWSTVIMLVIVGASSALPMVLQEETTYRVAVVAPAPRGLDAALQRAAEPFDAKVRVQVVRSAAAGRDELDAKKVDALLLLGDDRIVFRKSVDTQLAAAADTAVRALRRHLPPAPELTTATLEPADETSEDAEALSRCSAPRFSSGRWRSTANGYSPAWSRKRATASSS